MHVRGAKLELATLLPNTMSHVFGNGRHGVPEPAAPRGGLFARLEQAVGRVVRLPSRRPAQDQMSAQS